MSVYLYAIAVAAGAFAILSAISLISRESATRKQHAIGWGCLVVDVATLIIITLHSAALGFTW